MLGSENATVSTSERIETHLDAPQEDVVEHKLHASLIRGERQERHETEVLVFPFVSIRVECIW